VSGEEPVLTCHWEFGDGSNEDGLKVHHAYTQAGEYTVRVTATGLEASTSSKTLTVKISGNIATRFVPADKKRPE
jgi:alpha-galactosidase